MPRTGRPKIQVDWKEFEKLCSLQCTLIEIADWFGCSVDTMERRIRTHYKSTFAEVFKQKRSKGLVSLRRYQWKLAQSKHGMAIFLGKNYLGQSDKREYEHSGGVKIIKDDI